MGGLAPICRSRKFSSGVTQDGRLSRMGLVEFVGFVAAHELGHNFGMRHDNEIGNVISCNECTLCGVLIWGCRSDLHFDPVTHTFCSHFFSL